MMVLAGLTLLASFVAGMFAFVFGLLALRTHLKAARIGAAPHLTCAQVLAGQSGPAAVQVAGRAVPGPRGPLRAPLSGADCVWYRQEVWYEYRRTHHRTDMPTEAGRVTVWENHAGPYRLADDTGHLLVDPVLPGETMWTPFERTVEEMHAPEEPREGALGKLIQLGLLPEQLLHGSEFPQTYATQYGVSEVVIRADQALYVHGAVEGWLDSEPVLGPRGVRAALVSSRLPGPPAAANSRRFLGCLVVPAVLAVGLFVLAGVFAALATR